MAQGLSTAIQPLGQTFKVSQVGGAFLTEVDLFFCLQG